MDERILKFRVGILVVISMLILGILILTISGKPFFGSSYQLSGTTKNASGISSGTPIKKLGLPIGRVTKVAPSPNGKEVTVWMSIQETDSNGLKQTIDTSTEMAVIGSESILGDVVINIEPAEKEKNKSQIESKIIITKSNPIEAVLGKPGSSFIKGFDNLFDSKDNDSNLGRMTAKIESTAESIENMFARDASSNEEPPNLARALGKLEETSNSINDMFKRDNPKTAPDYKPNLAEAIANIDSLLGEEEQSPKITLRSALTNFKNLLGEEEQSSKTTFRSALSSIEQTSDIAQNTFSRYGNIPNEWNGKVKDKVIELINNASLTAKSLEAKPDSLLSKALSNEKMGTDFNTINESLAGIALRAESLSGKINEGEILKITAKLNLLLDDLRFFGDSLARNPGSIVRGALRPRNDIGPKSSPAIIWYEDGYFQE